MKKFTALAIKMAADMLLPLLPWTNIRKATGVEKTVHLDHTYYGVNLIKMLKLNK